jgi:hypothetical protein
MMDLNDLVPSGSGLVLTAGEFINDRGEIGASGVLPNGDHHAILLLPCDQRCDSESFSDGSERSDLLLVAPRKAATSTQNRVEMLTQFHTRMTRRFGHVGKTHTIAK